MWGPEQEAVEKRVKSGRCYRRNRYAGIKNISGMTGTWNK